MSLKILLVEPGKKPVVMEIDGALKTMQKLVGGYIQAVYPFEEPVALICNEEGKVNDLPLNRALRDSDTGKTYDIVAGTFFLCATPPDSDSFESLSEEQVRWYMDRFAMPELFLELDGKIVVVPVKRVQ